MNQKGFIVIPALIWWIIGATVLVGASKSGLVTVNLSGKQGEVASVTETAKPNVYLPPPASTSTPTPTPKPVQQIAPTIDPDPIINCNFPQNGIKKLKRSECSKSFDCQIGEKWYIYTDKNKCSEDQKNYWSKVYSPSTGNSNLSPSEPLVDCVLSYGTYQLTQATCDSSKASDKPYTPPQYYSCTLCDPIDGYCTTYNYLYQSKEECDTEQQKRNQQAETFLQKKEQLTTFEHNSQVTSCQSAVNSRYQGLLQSCYFYSGSTAQGCRQIYTDQRQREYDACGTTY